MLCCHSSWSQFASVGATWTYNDYYSASHQNFPRAIVSVADTVINGFACHVVVGDCACGNGGPGFIYESGRKIYLFNTALNAFHVLYDFNLNANEQWTVIAKNASADSLRLQVDSVSTDTINGVLCKVQFIHTMATYGNAGIFEGPLVEKIGSKFCLYPQSASCDPPTFGLRCYEDNQLGLYDTGLAPACDEIFVDSGIGISEISKQVVVSLSPNPFQQEAILTLSNIQSENYFFEIIDATGRIVREEMPAGEIIVIRKDNLEEGIYFYKISLPNGPLTGKFIIN